MLLDELDVAAASRAARRPLERALALAGVKRVKRGIVPCYDLVLLDVL